jgi:16S rRNA (guanine527-N7)-methyltransferase
MTVQLGGAMVSRETEALIAPFEDEFRRWAARINLVAPSTLPDFRKRHMADSAQVLALAPDALRIIDLGSGGGFPGLVIALLLRGKAGAEVHLIESNTKKCSFLRHMAQRFQLPAIVHNDRIERVIGTLPQADLVTARALAPLPLLLDLALPQLGNTGRALFHKGRGHAGESDAAHGLFAFELLVHPSGVDPDGVLLDIRNVRRKSA